MKALVASNFIVFVVGALKFSFQLSKLHKISQEKLLIQYLAIFMRKKPTSFNGKYQLEA